MTKDFCRQPIDQVAALAKDPNKGKSAKAWLWEDTFAVTNRIARNICRKYPWIDVEDVIQEVSSEFRKIFVLYDPAIGNWRGFINARIGFRVKDCLRKQDPLGISFPQKQHHPEWSHLSAFENEANIDLLVANGAKNIEHGYEMAPA